MIVGFIFKSGGWAFIGIWAFNITINTVSVFIPINIRIYSNKYSYISINTHSPDLTVKSMFMVHYIYRHLKKTLIQGVFYFARVFIRINTVLYIAAYSTLLSSFLSPFLACCVLSTGAYNILILLRFVIQNFDKYAVSSLPSELRSPNPLYFRPKCIFALIVY